MVVYAVELKMQGTIKLSGVSKFQSKDKANKNKNKNKNKKLLLGVVSLKTDIKIMFNESNK